MVFVIARTADDALLFKTALGLLRPSTPAA